MKHRIKLLGCTTLFVVTLLIIYCSMMNDHPRQLVEHHSQVHSGRTIMDNPDRVRTSNKAKPSTNKNRLHSEGDSSSVNNLFTGNTAIHGLTNSVAFNEVRRSLFQLQCNHQYKDYYRAAIDPMDITQLAVPKHFATSDNRTGYILSLTFREQQTKASENLFSLQCWANTLNVYVVEPFIQDSHLVAPPSESMSGLLKFRDVTNIIRWQKITSGRGFAPLAAWDKFIQEAPRQLIVVYFKYPRYSYLREKKESGEKRTHLAIGDEYTKGCIMTVDLADKVRYLTTTHHFEVVRKACMNFEHGDELTVFQFNSHVYGHLNPSKHTVLMEQWRGVNDIASGNRVSIYEACWAQNRVNPFLFNWPSHRLICDADKYMSEYLRSDQYIALVVRTEKFKLPGIVRTVSRVSECLNQTLDVWRKLKNKTKLKLTFLSMDIGKYGSYTLTDKNPEEEYRPYIPLYKGFFKEVFGPGFSIEQWENQYNSVTTSQDSGYIGSLQKILAAKAKCVVFSGGGSFQKHAKFLYETVHKKKCVKIVHGCSRGI